MKKIGGMYIEMLNSKLEHYIKPGREVEMVKFSERIHDGVHVCSIDALINEKYYVEEMKMNMKWWKKGRYAIE